MKRRLRGTGLALLVAITGGQKPSSSEESVVSDEKPRNASNVVLWAWFAFVCLLADGLFLLKIHDTFGVDLLLAVLQSLARTAVFVLMGVVLESLLIRAGDGYFTLSRWRRSVLHTYWILVMSLCVALLVDGIVFAFAGYHLPTAARILFADGPRGVGKVIEATGLSPSLVAASIVSALLGLSLAIVLSKVLMRLSARARIVIVRHRALRAFLVTLGVLFVVEALAVRVRNPFLWERETQQLPLAFSLLRPDAEMASFRVSLRTQRATPLEDSAPDTEREQPLPDVFIVILESLRRDRVTAETMPNLAAFAKTGVSFDRVITTGNVTHYSWYGLLASRYPIYFEQEKAATEKPGSVPLAELRRAGYAIELFATPDTDYQQMKGILFGSALPGLREYHPTMPDVAARDENVIRQLSSTLANTAEGGRVYVVALDSTHFPYAWSTQYKPKVLPYSTEVPITKDYARDARARALLMHRYDNSVGWLDGLVGDFIESLRRSQRLDSSIVVITGDHGEAFWERGSGTHGSDLGREQLEVGFAMKLPGRPAEHFPRCFSLLDVMPTLLTHLGLPTTGVDGVPLQRGERRAAVSFQGWNEQGMRFALTTLQHRMLFELETREPGKSQRLLLTDITDTEDRSLLFDASAANPGLILEAPALLKELTFLQW